MKKSALTKLFLCLVALVAIPLSALAQNENPIIIIPGLAGSELVNQKTGEVVWFKFPRSKDDDLRLPVSANIAKNRDNLIAGDILRSLKFGLFPRIDVYSSLIEAFKTNSGYHEELWDTPSDKAAEKAIYVYPYDWRLDNVENARLLVRKVADLKVRLKKPNLKFNLIGHSMGGIIARYAAMYGDADLPTGSRRPVPTYAGAKHFDKIVLLGTPNEGSTLALRSQIHGSSINGLNINLPWVQNLSKFDVFTVPSGYQLMPAPGTFQMLDENLKPIAVNIYDPRTWAKYGWSPVSDKNFFKELKVPARTANAFLAAVLDRARRLHEALSPVYNAKGLEFFLVGSECKVALDTIVVIKEPKSGKWKTLFKPEGFTKSTGEKVSEKELEKVMYTAGDGVVTKRSFETATLSKLAKVSSILKPIDTKLVCEEHQKLGANPEIQTYLVGLFSGKATTPTPVSVKEQ
jgi:pimeloyl-ACP methyl ester carboxylesterase